MARHAAKKSVREPARSGPWHDRGPAAPAAVRSWRIGRGPTLACLAVLICLAMGLQSTVVGKASDAASIPREYLLKAAFLYNFAKFTHWPDRAFRNRQTPLRFCFIGKDAFGPALQAIKEKRVQERSVVISQYATHDGLDICHLLFIGSSEQAHVREILESLHAESILTIADMPEFARSGGIIGFKTVENRIRFEINLKAAERVGLRFDSELLMVAEVLRDERKAATE